MEIPCIKLLSCHIHFIYVVSLAVFGAEDFHKAHKKVDGTVLLVGAMAVECAVVYFEAASFFPWITVFFASTYPKEWLTLPIMLSTATCEGLVDFSYWGSCVASAYLLLVYLSTVKVAVVLLQ